MRHTLTDSSQSHHRRESATSAFYFEQVPKKMPRYYAQALTEEDKQALARGERNHNHKEWSGKDLVIHHGACKDLVPCVMPQVETINALVSIEHDTKQSQCALAKVKDKVAKALRVAFQDGD